MSETPPPIDIRPEHWAMVREILRRQVPQYAVWAFGSRAKWTAKPYSDLDLAIITERPLSLDVGAALADAFSESDLPWRVDVVDWATTSESFRRIIEQERVVVQEAVVVTHGDRCPEAGIAPAPGPRERPGMHSHAERGNEKENSTLGELRARGLLDFGDGYRAKNSELGGKGPVFLRAAYLQDSGFVLDNPERFIAQELAKFGPKVSRTGDVVVTTKGNSTGRIGVIREHEAGAVYSPHLSYWRSLNPERIDQSFLYYWSMTEEFRGQLRGLAHSTDMAPYLSLRDQGFLRITLPDIKAQRSISGMLSALDARIELNRRMNKTLEAMARALFKDWFVDFGPTRAKQAGMEPYLAPELWSLFPERLDVEGKPKGWAHKPLTALFSVIGGGTPKTYVDEYWGGDIPWFSVVDTPPLGSVFVLATEKMITPKGLDESAARRVREGTTIISARGTVGNLAMAGQSMTFNQSCYGLQAKGDVGDCFVFLAAQNMIGRLQTMAHGSVFSTITRLTFDAVTLALASPEILKSFDEVTHPLFRRIKASVWESRTLTQTRDLLLPKLMSGEIRVRDAERLTANLL